MWISSHPAKLDGPRSGFTLIEVIVAASVAVFLLTALLKVFGSVWYLNGRVSEEAAAIVVAQAVMEQSTQRTSLKPGAQSGRSGNYGWSVQITPVAVAAPERPPQARRTRSTSSADGDDGDEEPEDSRTEPEEWNWQLFRVQVAVLSPSGRTTNVETLRLAPGS